MSWRLGWLKHFGHHTYTPEMAVISARMKDPSSNCITWRK